MGDQGAILVGASDRPAQVLIGTARRHAHPLVLGPSSVHTNAASLASGARRIAEIGEGLQPAS